MYNAAVIKFLFILGIVCQLRGLQVKQKMYTIDLAASAYLGGKDPFGSFSLFVWYL